MQNTVTELSATLAPEIEASIEANIRSAKVDKYQIFYINEANFQEIYNEIFIEHTYEFKTDKERPFIIDCGSNIGMATIYLKIKYPNAKIICFEPDPIAYFILCKNIKINNLTDILTINAGLAQSTGEVDFFGEFSGKHPNSLGNSIIKEWGDRNYTGKIKVQTVKLSDYIHNEEIDFLKIDVEGAEIDILEDLGKKLDLIKTISLEVHQANNEKNGNKLDRALEILAKHNFLTTYIEKNIKDLLPPKQQKWVSQCSPKLFVVNAQRS